MKYALIAVGLVGLLIAVVLGIKYHNEADRLGEDLAAQSDTTAVVRSQLAVANDFISSKLLQLSALMNERDSLSRSLDLSAQRADRYAVTARQLRASLDSLQTLSDTRQTRIDQLTAAASNVEQRLTDTTAALADARKLIESTSNLVKERTVLISQIQPWYAKWKHDATERNWLEKLFGSGKAGEPDLPEPVFPFVPGDSLPADSLAEVQASK